MPEASKRKDRPSKAAIRKSSKYVGGRLRYYDGPGEVVYVQLNSDEWQMINLAARYLKETPAVFMRRVAMEAARNMARQAWTPSS